MTNPITTPNLHPECPLCKGTGKKSVTGFGCKSILQGCEICKGKGTLLLDAEDLTKIIEGMRSRPVSGLSAGDREKLEEALRLIESKDHRYMCDAAHVLIREVLSSSSTETEEDQWISVEDKLPENGVVVLTHGPSSGGFWDYEVAKYFDKGDELKFWTNSRFVPVHWMPISAAPLLDRLAGKATSASGTARP